MKHNDIGKKFGRLVCVGYGPVYIAPSGKTHRTLRCVCDCGGEKTALAASIRASRTASCGCAYANRPTKHGRATRSQRGGTYNSWAQMRSRCNNKNVPEFKHYGGRGIKVCDRWASFELFLADMGERPPGTSIDRLDVNGDYRQDNCRWATRREQSLNTTRSRRIAASGIEMTLSEWAEATGLTPNCIRSRIKRGWTPEQAVRP